MEKFIVAKRFKDAKEFVKAGKEPKLYEPGEDVSKFSKKRLENLVDRGLVELVTEGDPE